MDKDTFMGCMSPPSPADLAFYSCLSPAYWALKLACQDSVLIPNSSYFPDLDRFSPFDLSRVYFYAEDNGESIVRERVKDHGTVIQEAYQRHMRMCEVFERLENALGNHRRQIAADAAEELCEYISSHGTFVATARLPFLTFPSHRGCHYSLVEAVEDDVVLYERESVAVINRDPKRTGAVISRSADFNPKHDREGLEREVERIRRCLLQFRLGGREMITKIYNGMADHTYRKSLELTEMLLRKHIGFPLA